MKTTKILIILLSFLSVNVYASQPVELLELKSIFEKYNVEGSILIYNQKKNTFSGYNLDRCNTPYCPASTFKIANSLIALETSVATMRTVFRWDGKKRYLPEWEKDMTIGEAFKLSAVPVYQEIARRIGVERMRYYARLFNYGNLDINADNIDKFWLEGNSSITQYQQIYFLRNLYNLTLPISKKTMEEVKEIMVYEKGKNYTLSGKTGWAMRSEESILWFVGYVETGKNVYFFATNILAAKDADLKSFGKARIDLTKEVFGRLGIIKLR